FPPQRLLSGGASHERQTLAARRTRLDGDDALGLGAFRPVDRIELHLCALGERLESVARDRRMVDEHVLATISRGNEPIPLRIVEPFHGSACHTNTSSTTKERAEDAHTAQPVLAQVSVRTVARPRPRPRPGGCANDGIRDLPRRKRGEIARLNGLATPAPENRVAPARRSWLAPPVAV